MRKLLLGTVALIALSGAAKAEFVAVGCATCAVTGLSVENFDIAQNGKLNLNSNSNVTLGTAEDNSATPNVTITSPNHENFDEASGWSTIKPDHSDTAVWNSLTFTPNGVNFSSFTTRGQLESVAGNVFITVVDNFGQTFSFAEPKSSDWDPIGVEAIAGSGEFIKSITITTDDKFGFKELKQETFGLDTAAVAGVPEPASWALMLLGFFGIGGLAMAKRRREGGAAFRLV